MSYKLTVSEKPTYLHAVVTGQNSKENVVRYMEEVIRQCTLRQCFRVLVEERLVGPRLGTLEIFEMAAAGAARYLGVLQAMAYVDVNAEGDTMQFAENVAVNRAVPVKVFASVAAAEKWLLGEKPARTDADASAPARKPQR